MANFVVLRDTFKRMSGSGPLTDIYFGCDSFLILREPTCMNLESFAEFVKYYFGMEINQEKSYWTSRFENIRFLGYGPSTEFCFMQNFVETAVKNFVKIFKNYVDK